MYAFSINQSTGILHFNDKSTVDSIKFERSRGQKNRSNYKEFELWEVNLFSPILASGRSNKLLHIYSHIVTGNFWPKRAFMNKKYSKSFFSDFKNQFF